MIIKKRKILFWFFTLIFILLSFLIIMYSQGYKIDFSWPINYKSLRKTGQLVIKTQPEGARIYINGHTYQTLWEKYLFKQKNKTTITPQKIKNLFPGEYNITLKLDNYHDLHRKVKIYSGKITNLDNLNLFKNNPPLKMNGVYFSQDNVSPDKEIIIYPKKQYVLKLDNNRSIKIKSNKGNVKWSGNSEYFSVGNMFFSINNLLKPKYNLDELIGTRAKYIHINENGKTIFYEYKNSIYLFNLSNREDKKILSQNNIQDYFVKNDVLFTISSKNQNIIFTAYNIKYNKIIRTIELPYSQDYIFNSQKNKLINIYNKKYKLLYVINLDSLFSPIQEIINNVKYFKWMDEKTLIYANDFEIWNFDITDHRKKIITRISDKIKGILVRTKTRSIIYWTNNNITLLEYNNNNNKIHTTNLTHMDSISNLIISKDEKIIYFNGKIGRQTGTYKLYLK